jgi:hypothetical protein
MTKLNGFALALLLPQPVMRDQVEPNGGGGTRNGPVLPALIGRQH